MSTQSTTKPVLVKITIAEIAAEIAQAAATARETVRAISTVNNRHDDVTKAIAEAREGTLLKQRWVRAITKAEQWLLEQVRVQYHVETHTLLVMSSKADKMYFANGSCQCEAYEKNSPCYHRAASRLITRALELAAAKAAPAPVAEAPAPVAARGPNEGTGTIDDLFN